MAFGSPTVTPMLRIVWVTSMGVPGVPSAAGGGTISISMRPVMPEPVGITAPFGDLRTLGFAEFAVKLAALALLPPVTALAFEAAICAA